MIVSAVTARAGNNDALALCLGTGKRVYVTVESGHIPPQVTTVNTAYPDIPTQYATEFDSWENYDSNATDHPYVVRTGPYGVQSSCRCWPRGALGLQILVCSAATSCTRSLMRRGSPSLRFSWTVMGGIRRCGCLGDGYDIRGPCEGT